MAADGYEKGFFQEYLNTVIEDRKRRDKANKEDELRKQEMQFEFEKLRLVKEIICKTANQSGS